MKFCPNCHSKYPDDANFCPQEGCALGEGPRRLEQISPTLAEPPPSRFEIESQLGGSRSGEVWRARDSQTGETVAYKLVAQASLPTTATLERALRELKQLQRSQSSRIARVIDFGKDPAGRLFIASELVEGQTLDRLVDSGPLSLDRAKAIVAQIGEALLEGQKVGVVHHDLSPKNVLVGSNDEVKVINFVAPVALSETVFGVPEYLSPEQAEGKLVDQRSNTYSLGGLLLLLLSGQPPVSGANGDAGAALAQVTKGEIVPPSRRLAGNTTLTPEIDRVVLKAMDKSPNRRPLTLRQFLTEVSGMVGMGAAPAAGGGVGFAKTMLFSGGSPEVQKLVQQAIAARGGAAPAAPAAPAPEPTPAPTPPPAYAAAPPAAQNTPAPTGPRRTHGAAIAATVVSLPAAKLPGLSTPMPGASPHQSGLSPPPPVAATPPLQAISPTPGPGPAPTPKPAAGGNFRETLWFKKGDVDQMVADARARVEAARAKGIAVPDPDEAVAEAVAAVAPPEEGSAQQLDERYVDDGSVTTDDRKKFSLRSGATSTALPTVGGAVPGERMSDAEVMGEIGGTKRIVIIIIAAVVVVIMGIVGWKFLRAKDVSKNAAAMTPAAIPTVTPPPPPEVAPPTAAAKPPAPTAAKDGDEAPSPKVAHQGAASKKHVVAKGTKPKGKKARK